MEFLIALWNTDPAELFVAFLVIVAICNGGFGREQTQDDIDAQHAFDHATWNPASVNYKE